MDFNDPNLQQLFNALSHPATLSVFVLIAAGVCGALVSWQAQVLGLDGRAHERSFPWSRLFGFGAFWAVLMLGMAEVVAVGEGRHLLAEGLNAGFRMLLGLVPGAAVLAGADMWRRRSVEQAQDAGREELVKAQRQAKPVLLVAGGLAALSVTRLDLSFIVLMLGVGVFVGWIALDADLRRRLFDWLEQLTAGQTLRNAHGAKAGATLQLTDGQVEVVSLGLDQVTLREDGAVKVLPNKQLLVRMPSKTLAG